MSHYKPYPAYKDSGVEWVGSIPSSWSVMPLFSVAEERAQSNKGMLEDNLLSLSYGNIVRKDINSFEGLVPESYETYQVIEAGDVVFRLTDLQNDKRSLRSAKCSERGIITSAYVAVAPKQVESGYFSYLMRCYDQVKVFYSMGGGMRQSMKFDDLRRMMVLLPTCIEQQCITSYLDRETVRIDALVDKKTRFIELLREKRQALITHAVTKGLDPNVKMKDSGVEWLGEVPEHWAHSSISRFFQIKAGGDLKDEYFSPEWDESHPYPIYTNSNKPDAVYGYTCIPLFGENTITVTGRGEIGYAVYRNQQYDAIIRLLVLTPKSEGDCKYAAYFINSVLRFFGGSTAVAQLSAEQIAPYPMMMPPLKERVQIVEFLDKVNSRIENLIKKIERSIELLKERRSALITAAATGQIDLREAA